MGASASSINNSTTSLNRIADYEGLYSLKRSCSSFEIGFRIRNFSYHCKNTKVIRSSAFASDDGMMWKILVIPNEICHNYKAGFVFICLIVLNETEIHCITRCGERRCKKGMLACADIVSTEYLLIESLDHKDVLELVCKIKCVDHSTQKYFLGIRLASDFAVHGNTLKMLGDFGELLNNSELSDVDLITAEGKVFKVHKAVLAARSKVFLAMFQNNMLEHQTSIVKIEDFSGSVLEQVLKFIYTSKSEITDENVKDVLLAADKYDIGSLKSECIDYLYDSINTKNAIELLEFAQRYDIRDLKLKTQLFIAKHAKDIAQQPDFDLAILDSEVVNQLFRQIAINSK